MTAANQMDTGELYTCIQYYTKDLQFHQDKLQSKKATLKKLIEDGSDQDVIDKELESIHGLKTHVNEIQAKLDDCQAQYDEKRGPIRPMETIRAEIEKTMQAAAAINKRRNDAIFVNPDASFSAAELNNEMISCLLQRTKLIDETFKTGLTDVEKREAYGNLRDLHHNLSTLYLSQDDPANSEKHSKLRQRYEEFEVMFFKRTQD